MSTTLFRGRVRTVHFVGVGGIGSNHCSEPTLGFFPLGQLGQ